MSIVLKEILLIIAAYILGSVSFARIFSRLFRKVNVYKAGNFTADPGNVYHHVSKSIGILSWFIDFVRVYVILFLTQYFFLKEHSVLLLFVGLAVVIAHYFPIFHNFLGGYSILPYIALLCYFAPIPTLIIGIISLVVIISWKQVRFSKYLMVIMVPALSNFYNPLKNVKVDAKYLFLASVIMGVVNYLVSRRRSNEI
ncbi:MAG TPA: glycerol-3-phosphate acyltransferase [Candidatus Cloacimonetes bacterium]|nr:glycerol-3-phosphate acyltransferase [Candidatus Cloacimonadota bacterium]HEX37917.1 glycerol-3-phosphate acyltransferase [Candidatus Cloacimonadota bacterium]